ncbi:6,7-dimethyl-8-ribityllumazine synthase [Noviherbaspirillum cavernae]|uniref:6,7-dimethyl-8-ribityllumazine synthase n=1 Tax=Noviherbaspirillum cavernae TaxID=2320862 RepID=A0A418X1W4_9BURK|nr:6,7-dimethyl-8-ribityllumazine synthase [Noviherbaspirillum cavernae]RJG06436.1 6,7-dimethyl-8-ribityllumazine synthase [Noviherbaspirillum cavernae]
MTYSQTGISPARIAFVQSGWHREIVDRCRLSFLAEMGKRGFSEADIDFFEVTGAFEIPLHAKLLAKTGKYAAVVAAGLVVDGGIYRHEFVAQAVITALMQVQLETEVPVISAVLTPHHFHSHAEHQQFFLEHFVVKGAEAATACADTLAKVRQLKRMAGNPARGDAVNAVEPAANAEARPVLV